MLGAGMRLEGIRPGGAVEGHLAQQPFAELLIGALRANLDGRLSVALSPGDRNWIDFHSGVPVSVSLPDIGPGLVSMLVEEGSIPADQGERLLKRAETGSQSEVVEGIALLTGGALREARARRARAQLVRLISRSDLDFRFVEGQRVVDPAKITLLEPLPLLFQGFLASPEAVRPHLPPEDAALSFGPTYPQGLDPLGLGADLEAAIAGRLSMEELVRQGFARRRVEAAAASLALVDMLVVGPPSVASSPPESPARPPIEPLSSGASSRASLESIELPRPIDRLVLADPEALAPEDREPAEPTPAEVMAILTRALEGFENKSYFEILRVGSETDLAQLERAYRYLLRRVLDQGGAADSARGNGTGSRLQPSDPRKAALAELFQEAYVQLRDPELRKRYRLSSSGERRGIEAEAKAERALRIAAVGRFTEAIFLVRWVVRLVPGRSEYLMLRAGLEWLGGGVSRGPSPADKIEAELGRTGSRHLRQLLSLLEQNGGFKS